MPSRKPLQQQIDELKKQNEQILHALERAGMLEARAPEPVKEIRAKTTEPIAAAIPTVEQRPAVPSESISRRESSIEVNIGTRWFSWIGVITLVIGVGFFVKYAIDNNLVTHLARILIGAGFGIVLASVGAYTSRISKYRQWGQSLLGGGLAIVYFVVYASYHLEEYRNAIGISQPLVILLLSVVALATLFFSLKDNSQVIAGEAFLLGFITALVTGNIQTLTLVYSSLLAGVLIVVVAYKQWPAIGIGGLLGSYILYLLWYTSGTQPFGLAFIFLAIYFLAYTVQSFLLMLKKDSSPVMQISNIVLTIINAEFFSALSFDLVRTSAPAYDAILLAGLSLFYFCFSYIAHSIRQSRLSITGFALAISSLAFAILFHFDGAWVTVAWSALIVLLMLLWLQHRYRTILYSACGVGLLAAVKVFFYDSWMLKSFDWASSIQDSRALAFASIVFSFAILVSILHRVKDRTYEETFVLSSSAWVAVAGVVLIGFLEFVRYPHITSLIWAALALLLLHLYFNKGYHELRYQVMTLSCILAVKILFTDSFLVKMSAGVSWRVIAFMAGIVLCYAMSFYLHAQRQRMQRKDIFFIEAFSITGTTLLFFLIPFELKEYWISIAWGVVGLILLILGFLQGRKYIRYQGLILFGFTILKAFLYDTRELPTIYRTISFIALGGVFIATSFIYSKYKDKIKEIL